jgi:hypothetical protein
MAIPAYRVAGDVAAALDSVAKLDWPNFECIGSSNTPEANLWRPIEEHCDCLGHAEICARGPTQGFKAGAPGSRSTIRRLKLRSSACSTPITWFIRLA